MKRQLIITILAVVAYQPVAAQDGVSAMAGESIALTEESALSDYLSYAALHNPRLQAAFAQWQASVARIPQATALPDPRFTFSYFIQEVETRVGPQRRSLALTQTFPWLGKLKSRGDAAARAADAAEQKYEAEKLGLFYRVKQAYYEYYYLARSVEIAEEHVQLLTYLEEVALTAYASGKGSHADAMKAQIELGKAEDLLQSLRDKRRPVMARLNAELNRPPAAPLSWPKKVDENRGTAIIDEQFLDWFRENPRFKSADFTVESRRADWSLAKKQFIPDLTLGVKVIDTDPARMPGIDDSGKNPVVATFSFNIPLWFGKHRAGARQKKAQYHAALAERTDLENKLTAELETALFDYRDAERKRQLYGGSLLPKAQQHFEVTQQAFISGEASFLDLVDAQRTLLDFTLALERAFVDRAQRLAELDMRVGHELPRVDNP